MKTDLGNATQKTRLRISQTIAATVLSIAMSLSVSSTFALAAVENAVPSGTLLIPLQPKLDFGSPKAPDNNNAAQTGDQLRNDQATEAQAGSQSNEDPKSDTDATQNSLATKKKRSPGEEAFAGTVAEDTGDTADDTTLSGTVQIVADDTEYDQEKNTFLGTGNAVALIGGQSSKLEADSILYDQTSQIIDARGNVRILRNGQLTTGSSFKFNVSSDEYLITNPDTELNGTQVIARKAIGGDTGLNFRNGTMLNDVPITMNRNTLFGPVSYREILGDRQTHPDAFLPAKPSFKFKARKMIYERYKEQGNLTVIGGRMEMGAFTFPMPKFTMTTGNDSKVTFPVTFIAGNNMQVGGFNIGPRFNYQIGKTGVLSWAPLIQVGGTTIDGAGSSKSGGLGVGAQVGYINDRLSTHLGYGSVSNLLVADFKAAVYKNVKVQAGINRFLDDGMFGTRRAHLDLEAIDNHSISCIPFIQLLNFRTSAGWAQDDPQLLNLTPQYKQLFGSAANTTVMNKAMKYQEQITAETHPLFSIGDTSFGAKSYIYGGVALRDYSTGQASTIGQLGPVLDLYLRRVRLQTGYTQSAARGSSPFVFDQFIQGSRSTYISGDVKLAKWVTVGGSYAYNMDDKLAYGKALTAAVGPEDFKVVGSYDLIRGTNRIGFDILYGAPIPFDKLVLKGRPDQGQLGGI